MVLRLAGLAAVLTLLACVGAGATDRFGTAGSFASVGWDDCGKTWPEITKGLCDPAMPDSALTGDTLARAHVGRAKTLVAITRVQEAMAAATLAIEAAPQNIEALIFRARLALTLGNRTIAERDLNVALEREPRNPALLATRAEVMLDRGTMRAALEDIDAAQEILPNNFDVFWIKARIYTRLKQTEQAEEYLGRALAIQPEDRRVRLLRAQLRLREGKFAGAAEDASVVMKKDGDPSAAEVNAVANTALGRRAEAVEALTLIFGPPGDPTPAVTARHYYGLLLQRVILLVQLDRQVEAAKDIDTLVANGGKQGLLRLQVYLRRNGFADLPLSGERTDNFDAAFKACLLNQACARGLPVQGA